MVRSKFRLLMNNNQTMLLHWIIGTLAVIFILFFAFIPMSEFIIVLFSDDNAGRAIGKNPIWFMSSRTVYLTFNLIYGIANSVLFLLSLLYLIRKQSANLLITFAVFFSIFFFFLLLTGNWLAE